MGRHSRFKHLDDAQFLRCAEIHVDALNDALAIIPADRMRIHVCWGNYEGPHTHDIPLETILPLLLRAKPSALVIEGANPRHEHEWDVWTRRPLPDDKGWSPASSIRAPTTSSTLSWSRSASYATPTSSDATG